MIAARELNESARRPNWHEEGIDAVLAQLGTNAETGLADDEVARRRERYGVNELVESGARNAWLILVAQFTSLLILVLITAAGASALLGDFKDAIAIGAIVVLNAGLGFSQEYRAEKAIAALKKLAVPLVRVHRDGQVRELHASDLVPGDIVLLQAGNFVPADCRVLESAALEVNESALTGESEAVSKITGALAGGALSPADRRNMAYMGTFVTSGRGRAVVAETGMRTELGRIAALIQTVDRGMTPIQRRLNHLGARLAMIALALVVFIFVLGLLRGEDLKLMFLTAVSMGVAAVPEGLPAVVTIALTLGARRMLQRRALIRKLPAVETLGAVTVICSDKTGTLTENCMTATAVETGEDRLELGAGLVENSSENRSRFGLLLAGAALCNDARLQTTKSGEASTIGDPTETALLVAANRFGLAKPELEQLCPRIAEIPFSSERKRMTTVHRVVSDAGWLGRAPSRTPCIAFVKGAVDSLLEVSTSLWVHGKAERLDQGWRERLASANNQHAKEGRRVLGVALRWIEAAPDTSTSELERELTFVGMIAMIDPPRQEAFTAVEQCRAAGIRPVMITGDHALTAQNIAQRLGILGEGRIVTGAELDKILPAELEALVESAEVYARVSPEHKLKIVERLQHSGHIIAMTGDGVNDAPALKKADIGVAMGITGADVAKEAADMVLLDDNFATIVAAVEEGRAIYDNIRKFVRYILATNSGEMWVMLAAPLLGMPLPLLPLQILWMNLVTDGLPALALAVEPAESDTMHRPPRPPDESIFARGLGRHVIWVGLLMAFLSLASGHLYWRAGDERWQTFLFTTLTLSQMAHVLAIRSERQSLFRTGLLSNKPMLGAVTLTIVLQLALIYLPSLQAFFWTRALLLSELGLSVALSLVIFAAVESEKWVLRRLAHPSA
jgi:Ca2+-transporting ATPase